MSGTISYNGIQVSVESKLGIELMKFERRPDYRPENHQFPRMVYKAFQCEDGKVRCMRTEPSQFEYSKEQMGLFQRDCEAVKAFNESCQRIAKTEDELAILKGQGWVTNPLDAEEREKEQEYKRQDETAARIRRDRNMSPAAQEEIRAAEQVSIGQLTSMPVKPTVKKTHWKTLQKIEREKAKVSSEVAA